MSNASHITTIVARGISHWADCQNMPGDTLTGSWPDRKWKDWANRFPQYVEFVQAAQSDLFDRVNNAF